MSQTENEIIPAPAVHESLPAPVSNPAVRRCAKAYKKAWNAALAEYGFDPPETLADETNESFRLKAQYAAMCAAREAYRKNMPPLAGAENISDFLACLTYGIMCEYFFNPESSQLLYAAQVAQSNARQTSTRPVTRKPPKRR
jgi:hypothetical protein